MTTALDNSPVTDAAADLLLVRMALPGKKPPAPSVVRKDVSRLLPAELSDDAFGVLRNELAGSGFLTKGKRNTFALTAAGRERALRFLGIAELSAKTNWGKVIASYLFPKAAGLSAEAAAKLDSGDKLSALILRRKYGLSAGAGATVNQILQAIACKELGSDESTLEGLLCAVLSKLIGSERLTKAKLAKQLPLFGTGLTTASADAIRRKIVRDSLVLKTAQATDSPGASSSEKSESLESQPVPPFDLDAFAGALCTLAAKSPPQDRFHDNKVFIAPLWRTSQNDENFPRLSLMEFKKRLIEANSKHLLHLSRADMVQAMDPQLVSESETPYLNATFHFVLLEGNTP